MDEREKIYKVSKNKVDEISRYVNEGKEGIIEKDAVMIEKIINYLNLRNTMQKKVWLKVAGYLNDRISPLIRQSSLWIMVLRLTVIVMVAAFVKKYVLFKIYH